MPKDSKAGTAGWWAVAILAALAAAGCAGPKASGAATPVLATPAQSQPGEVAVQGRYVHAGSGLALPAEGTAGGARFTRTTIMQFDAKGLDVGASYQVQTPSGLMEVTAYVYPVPMAFKLNAPTPAGMDAARRLDPLLRDAFCHQELVRRENEVTTLHPAATLIREGTATAPQGETAIPGAVAVFEIPGLGAASAAGRSDLTIFCYVREFWVVKYRATPVRDRASEAILADFMRQVPWTLRPPQ